MFKKIKEFIKAFKDAYNTINIDKNNARKAISDFKKEAGNIIYAADSLKIIFVHLEAIYRYFPIKERQDFITKTLDLLIYGRKDANGEFKDVCGWCALYRAQEDYVNIKIKHLNELYKEGKYSEVILLAKKCNEQLKEFYGLHGIKETQNEENE